MTEVNLLQPWQHTSNVIAYNIALAMLRYLIQVRVIKISMFIQDSLQPKHALFI